MKEGKQKDNKVMFLKVEIQGSNSFQVLKFFSPQNKSLNHTTNFALD